MKVGIIGTGDMANALTSHLSKYHEICVYGRDEAEAKALVEQYDQNAKKLEDNIEEEIVILAVPYEAIPQLFEDNSNSLQNKILVDISNPLDWQKMELREGEGAEKLAGSLPQGAKLFKAFNTIFKEVLVKGVIDGKPIDVFIAGNDPSAKEKLSQMVNDAKLRAIDIGPLNHARFAEILLLINAIARGQVGDGSPTSIKILP